jgi:hypothetical protein
MKPPVLQFSNDEAPPRPGIGRLRFFHTAPRPAPNVPAVVAGAPKPGGPGRYGPSRPDAPRGRPQADVARSAEYPDKWPLAQGGAGADAMDGAGLCPPNERAAFLLARL